jgi:glycosyltransferase XagB
VPRVEVEAEDQVTRTEYARDWLADAAPELSARTLLSSAQRLVLIITLAVIVICLILFPLFSGIVLIGLATILYVGAVIYRIIITNRSLRSPNVLIVSDEEARAVPDADLPVYTVLVPMYMEATVIPELVGHLRALEYPAGKLDIKLLVEANDPDTITAVMTYADDDMQVVVVPDSEPRTKPKALNFGLTLAGGEFVTIYDAEDRPDPLQLRRAVVAFGRLPQEVGCLQAQLAYWNTDQNLLTRWFSIEYLQWFQLLLPGLSASDAPVPLGGTSNHMRRDLLDDVGGWDPYNVTEDADLGVRLHRGGYRSAVLASTTFEEANSDYVNWNNQRSRWYKGYIQTWLVHMRHPVRLIDELGWKSFLEFNAFVGGTPILALLNLAFWAMTLAWFVGHFSFIKELYPTAIYYPALFCFVFGNVAIWYQYLLAARISGRPSLVWAALGVPIYWLMMSVAAVKAFWQIATDRSFWEKTVHGLDPARAERAAVAAAAIATSGDREEQIPVVLAPAFLVPAAPPLAARIEHEAAHDRARWPGRIAGALQISGYVLMAFVVYALVFSGFRPAFATSSNALIDPLTYSPPSGAAIAKLSIPSVGINTTISEGTGAGALRRGVGHLSGTPVPGAPGDSVIIGHRVVSGGRLHALDRIEIGDDITVRTSDGNATYRVVSVNTQRRGDIEPAGDGPSRLMLVTGTPGINPGRLRVVQTELVGANTIRIHGPPPPYAGRATIPGGDGGMLVTALLCVGLAVLVLRLRRRLPEGINRRWPSILVAAAAAASMYAVFVAATRALPPTF